MAKRACLQLLKNQLLISICFKGAQPARLFFVSPWLN